MKSFLDMLQSVKDIKAQAGKLKEDLKGRTFEGSSADGLVRIVLSGDGHMRSVTVAPQAPPTPRILEAAIQEAHQKAKTERDDFRSRRLKEAMGHLPASLGALGDFSL